jgi:DUF1680 family protein
VVFAFAVDAEAQGRRGRGQQRDPSDTGLNLAVVAEPSTSHVSGDTRLSALNDGGNPQSSRRGGRGGTYGNWGNRRNTQWVQYDWPKPISTNKINVYWWEDGQGIQLPAASRLKYWNGTEFVAVANAQGLGVEADRYNTTTFDEVTTTKLRLEMDSAEDASTGIIEWKVYDSGNSPTFPPRVEAGRDRIVVLGGKTYLTAETRSLDVDPEASRSAAGSQLTWSKESGPGSVTFANASNSETTATFSAVGDYVLKLTAKEGELSSSDTLRVKVDAPPPAKPLGVVYTTRYKIDSPLWNARAKSLITSWIPHCIDQINTPNLQQGAGGIDNFIDAAAALRGEELPEGHGHRGYVFSNAWVHQTVESMCIALMVDPKGDPEIIKAQDKFKATLDDWIPKILAAQEPDGYLQTAFSMRRVSPAGRGGRRGGQDTQAEGEEAPRFRYQNGPFQRWSRRPDHEGYVAGYFIESAINHYTLTNGTDLRLYNGAKKLADCWVANIGSEPGKQRWYDGHQEMEQALVRFGRFVNDMEGGGKGDAYIKLAKFLLDCRGNGSEYDQSHVPVQQQYEAVGHAVRATYSYSGMADVATETGDLDYRSAVMSLWDSMVNKKYYVTGGIGSGETSEGFGPDYSLRHGAYCESCSTCGLIFFQYKMNLSYHDAKYADLYEESMYNALLGATDIAGKNFYYTNPLTGGQRTSWHNCPCCVGNIPRTLLMIPTWTYVTDDSGVYVNLFIGSTVKIDKVAGTNIEMVQKTDYPWSGNVSITVNPAESKQFTVRVRVPDRSVSEIYSSTPESNGITSLAVNGTRVTPEIEKGYAKITRTWKAGDKIDVVLPMKPQRVKSIDDVEANRGFVALRLGPLVYNIETADGNNLNGVMDTNYPLTTEWRPDLLEGVVVIKGKFTDGSDLTAVPHYVRNNRLRTNQESAAGGDAAVGAGERGAGAGVADANARGGQRRGRGRGRSSQSNVWIRDAE